MPLTSEGLIFAFHQLAEAQTQLSRIDIDEEFLHYLPTLHHGDSTHDYASSNPNEVLLTNALLKAKE